METRVLRDTLESLASVLFNHDLNRLHNFKITLKVGIDHGFVFVLVVVPLLWQIGATTNRRVQDRLAWLGMEDERSKKQTFDELDKRVAFLEKECKVM